MTNDAPHLVEPLAAVDPAAVPTPARGRRITVWLLLVAGLLLPISGLICVYFWPRQEWIGNETIGYYYGLGRHAQPGFLGKNWTSVKEENPFGLGVWEYQLDGFGWTHFRAKYADGRLMAEGVCWVDDDDGKPSPNSDRVLSATYYDPAGKIASRIVGGSGRMVFFNANGNKSLDSGVANTRLDGRWDAFWDNGALMGCGRYANGDEVRIELWFYNDGSVSEITNHSSTPPTEEGFLPGERVLSDEKIAELLAP